MSHPKGPYSPERCAADCYDWLTPEDVIRIALGAFYAACRYFDKSTPEEIAHLDGAGRLGVAEATADLFSARLHHLGYQANVQGFDSGYQKLLELWASDEYPSAPKKPLPNIHRRAFKRTVVNRCKHRVTRGLRLMS